MSTNTLRKRRIRKANSPRYYVPATAITRVERRERIHRYPLWLVTDDEEVEFVTRAAMWMMVLGVAPLLLFYIVTFFYPDFFLIAPS